MKKKNIEINALHKAMQAQIDAIVTQKHTTLEEMVVEGLKRKGFTFSCKEELYSFAKENITNVEQLQTKTITFYVIGEAFLIYAYGIEYNIQPTVIGRTTTVSAVSGRFQFL